MRVETLNPEQWKEMSFNAHLLCFNELKVTEQDRISFALLTIDDEKPLAYMTIQELDGQTAYLQHGGALPDTRGTANSYRAYLEMLKDLKSKGYVRAGTYIENKNKAMLRFAMKAGWLITGIRTFEGDVLVEHQLKFEELAA